MWRDLITLIETGLNFDLIIQELGNQLSMDHSLYALIPEMSDRIEALMEETGIVEGLNRLKDLIWKKRRFEF